MTSFKKNIFSSVIILSLALNISACKSFNKSSNSLKNYSASDDWIGEPDSGFRDLKKVTAQNFMVVSAHKLASNAGSEIIAQGGNAVDAAIAAQMVLNVVEPHSSGIGGGTLLLFHEEKSGKNYYYNGRETAPIKAKNDIFLDPNKQARKFFDVVKGGLSVGTPGTLKLLKEVHDKHGKLAWKKLFEPAIKIANEGFEVSQRFHNLSNEISYLKDFDQTALIYLDKNRQALDVGQKIKNPLLAKTLEKIANEGINDFYNGKIAQNIVSAVQNSKINPGFLSLEDLKKYRVSQDKLICLKYHQKYNVCTANMPSSGTTMLQILGILENFDLSKMDPDSSKFVHLYVEATRLAYADRNQYIGHDLKVPLQKLIDKNYLKKRAALINLDSRISLAEAGDFSSDAAKKSAAKKLKNSKSGFEPPSTTHMSIIDKEGNAVSMTSSIEYFFGSAVSVEGFLLNNQLTDFTFEPIKNGQKTANRLEPGKQPRTSMSPTFVFDENNNLIMVVGSPGGPRIIQFVAKTIINHLDFGFDVQESISRPNIIVLNDVIELEKGRMVTKSKKDLEKLGHQVKEIEIVSGVAAISLKKENNNLIIEGGADPRREGFAAGF